MNVNCTLANGEKSSFQGVGIAIMEVEAGEFIILAPAYLSKKDDVCTISPGALKKYSKCIKAEHEALEHLKITTKKKRTYTFKVESVAGLDYAKIKLHHFNSPLKTKLQRNPHLSVLPKLIFNPSRAVEAAESVGELNESPQVAAAKIRNDQAAMFLHLKFAHMSMDDIRKLKQKDISKTVQ